MTSIGCIDVSPYLAALRERAPDGNERGMAKGLCAALPNDVGFTGKGLAAIPGGRHVQALVLLDRLEAGAPERFHVLAASCKNLEAFFESMSHYSNPFPKFEWTMQETGMCAPSAFSEDEIVAQLRPERASDLYDLRQTLKEPLVSMSPGELLPRRRLREYLGSHNNMTSFGSAHFATLDVVMRDQKATLRLQYLLPRDRGLEPRHVSLERAPTALLESLLADVRPYLAEGTTDPVLKEIRTRGEAGAAKELASLANWLTRELDRRKAAVENAEALLKSLPATGEISPSLFKSLLPAFTPGNER